MVVDGDEETRLTKIETMLWGPFGDNGLKGEVTRLRDDIGQLFGRDDALRGHVNDRFREMEDRLNDKLDGLYKLMATLIVTILVGAGSIVATLVVTAK